MRKLKLILFLLLSSGAWAQTYLPVVQSHATTSTGSTCVYDNNVVSGDLLIATSVWRTATGTPSVSDTVTSSYAQAKLDTSNTIRIGIYIAVAASSGANTVTFTETGATGQTTICSEFPAKWGTTVDVSSSTSFSGTPATVTSGSITTTVNGDLLFSVLTGDQASGVDIAKSGFTPIGVSGVGSSASTTQAFKVSGATGSYTSSFDNFTNATGVIVIIAIKPASEQFRDTALPDGAVQQAYSYTLHPVGGTSAYSFSLSSGTLQSGLSLNSSTGIISGTPVQGGTRTLTFSDGLSATVTLDLRIGAALNTITATTIGNCSAYTATSGDITIVTGRMANASIAKVTDTLGATYHLISAAQLDANNKVSIMMWAGKEPSGGSNAVTLSSGATRTACEAFSNVQDVLDAEVDTTGSSGASTTYTSSSLSTLVPNSLLYSDAFTFTSTANAIQSPFTADGGNTQFGQGHNIVTTVTGYTVSYTPTNNTNGNWVIGLAALRPSVNAAFVQTHALKKFIGPF